MKKNTGNDKQTSTKIMDAAIPLFAKKGFAGVSVKELAEAAGVNIALISYYFGGKENLYMTILNLEFELLADLVERVKQQGYTPVERIKAFVHEVILLHKQNPDIENLIYSEIMNPTACYESVVKQGFNKVHYFLEDCMREAIVRGQFRADIKPDCASIALMSMIHFYLFTKHVADGFIGECEDKVEYYISEALNIYFTGTLHPNQ